MGFNILGYHSTCLRFRNVCKTFTNTHFLSVESLSQGRNWRGQSILTSLIFKGSLTVAGMSPELLTEKLPGDPEREAESESSLVKHFQSTVPRMVNAITQDSENASRDHVCCMFSAGATKKPVPKRAEFCFPSLGLPVGAAIALASLTVEFI